MLQYLEEAAVHTLFGRVDALSAPGSVLLYDIVGKTLLSAVVTDVAEPGNAWNRWFAPAVPLDVPSVPGGYFVEATKPV